MDSETMTKNLANEVAKDVGNDLAKDLAMVAALVRRSANELLRVPGAAIPGVMAPTIFFVGLTAVFGSLTQLDGFHADNYQSFLIPVSLLQGAGFTGAAAGVNLARDIEAGMFDRLLASPAPRWVLLAGIILASCLRAMVPATMLLGVGFAIGVHWPGIGGLLLAIGMIAAMASVASSWGALIALHFKTQSAAPLMQAGMLALILTTSAYAPRELLTGWLHGWAPINPATHIVEAARQGFTEGVSWGGTWPGLVALAGLLALLVPLALREMRRTGA